MGLKSFEKFVGDKMQFLTMIALLIAFVFSGIFMIYQSHKDLTDKRDILEQLVNSYVKLFSEIVEKKDVLYESFFEYIEKHSNDEEALEKACEIFNIDPENVSIEPLDENEEFEMAKNIALYHHEKFDGSGYPYGLKNDDIPMEALIAAFVDVYDALRSPRPYKRAFSSQEAFRIVTEGDGRTIPEHFHPDVLRVFIEHYKELEILWEMVKAGKTEDIIRE